MSDGLKKGWHPDPFGHYAERYYYADGEPGRLVRDDGRTQFYDDLPVTASSPDATRRPPAARPRPTRRLPTPEPINASLPPHTALPAAPAVDEGDPEYHPEFGSDAEVPSAPAGGAVVWGEVRATNDYFPDERVPWRVLAAARLRNLPRPSLPHFSFHRPTMPSRRTMYVAGTALGVVVLGIVLVLVMTSGPDSSPPSSAASSHAPQSVPPTQPPTQMLNGDRGSGSTTTTTTTTSIAAAVAAVNQSWATNSSYATSALNLTGIACPTTTQCFAVGETALKSAMVLASTNGGASWSQQNVQIPGALSAIACSSATSCIAVGGTTAASTTDGGTTWTPRQLGSNALTGVSCPSVSTCVAVGSAPPPTSGCASGSSYTTRTGGQSWVPTPTRCFVPSGVSCASATSCMMSGIHTTGSANYAAVVRSTDGGRSWKPAMVVAQANTAMTAISCPSTTVCVGVGNATGQPIVRTTNAGATWSPALPAGQANNYLAVTCTSTTSCEAGGVSGAVSTANGTIWTSASLPAVIIKVTGLACPTARQCSGVGIGQFAAPWTITQSA